MPLSIVTLQLGPMENNTYLLADTRSKQAAVIDPSFDSHIALRDIEQRGWQLAAVWLTHAHFDHLAGLNTVVNAVQPPAPVGIHRGDLALYRQGGGSQLFGLEIEPGPEPSIWFSHGQALQLGDETLSVRHTPGHTTGHVIFYSETAGAALCGDLIFYHGVGRTDLPGGSHSALLQSIRSQIFTLPSDTRLLSGHGPETTVKEELENNPFL